MSFFEDAFITILNMTFLILYARIGEATLSHYE